MLRRNTPFLLALLALLALPSCGFHPVYKGTDDNGSPVREELAQVEIMPMKERIGQILRNDLIDRFNNHGRPEAPLYHLSVDVSVAEENLGILANGTTTLAAILASGVYSLKDNKGSSIATGIVSSTGQYDKLNSMYGDLASKDAATERTLRELSEQITARISLYFAEHKNPVPDPAMTPATTPSPSPTGATPTP